MPQHQLGVLLRRQQALQLGLLVVAQLAHLRRARPRSEALRRLEIPADLQKKYGLAPLGPADGPVKTAVFGGNNARLYDFKPAQQAALAVDHLAHCREIYDRNPQRTNLAYGYALKDG